MKHLGTKPLQTQRLLLQPFSETDAQAMFQNWAADREVTKYLTWLPHRDLASSAAIVAEWIKNYEDKGYYHWAITLKSTGDEPLGSIGVNNKIDDKIKMAHMGYCIGKKWWHQGIVSEALMGVLSFLFEEVGIQRIESRHDPKNPNSGLVMKKSGMKYEGTLRRSDWNNQGVCDACYYAVLSEEWDDIKKNCF